VISAILQLRLADAITETLAYGHWRRLRSLARARRPVPVRARRPVPLVGRL